MIVCLCHRVSDRDIAAAQREGCKSFEELQDTLRVGTACGACHDCAQALFAGFEGLLPDRSERRTWTLQAA
jgi:bacterioferritin-associated ferredoxin